MTQGMTSVLSTVCVFYRDDPPGLRAKKFGATPKRFANQGYLFFCSISPKAVEGVKVNFLRYNVGDELCIKFFLGKSPWKAAILERQRTIAKWN